MRRFLKSTRLGRRYRCGPTGRRQRPALQLEPLESRYVLNAGPLAISEFMAINASAHADDDGDFSDWLEIHNPTNGSVNLDGWHLTDNAADPDKWTFPAIEIAAGEYLLVYASGKDRSDPAAPLHTSFRLDAGGEYLGLLPPDESVSWEYAPEYAPQEADVSYGLSADLLSAGYFTLSTPGGPSADEPLSDPDRQIIINEIMYHPSSENVLEEYVELLNRGGGAVNLQGWRLNRGVDFVFPEIVIGPGEYLAVAADTESFAAKYPTVAKVVGGWQGRLSNQSDAIELEDASGARVDLVNYADEGDWAVRAVGPNDQGHTGWVWSAEHDGAGKSLELVSSRMPNQHGQNWLPSISDQGTPGAANSRSAAEIAPLILDLQHTPPIPHSAQPVTVAARIVDELPAGLSVSLHWRRDDETAFTMLPMQDDGQQGDGRAGDGVYGARIPPQADGTVVEFYVQATDAAANERSWPAPAQGGGEHLANALFQVLDSFSLSSWTPGSRPIYLSVMTGAERQEFSNIARQSDAQMNATFISVDGAGVEIRYTVGVRIRGSGSRNHNPPNNRINIPSDRPWDRYTSLNLNAVSFEEQVVGSALHRFAGLPAPDAKTVVYLSNGQNLQNGFYAHLEPLGGEFAANHFRDDPSGNVYKGRRPNESPPGGQGAGLVYFGPDPSPYVSYLKSTNESEADWSDVIALTYTLNETSDEEYLEAVESIVNVDNWLRMFALNALIDNNEGGLLTGDRQGDDYAMYAGVEDPRFFLIPHDLDSLFGSTTREIFRPDNVPALNRLMHHPEVEPRYYAHLLDLMNNVFTTENIDRILQEAIGGAVSAGRINSIRQFLLNRFDVVRSLIPQTLTVASSLPLVDGFHYTNDPALTLSGMHPAADTQAVLVNGVAADVAPNGTWEIHSGFAPGATQLLIAAGSEWRFLDDGSNQEAQWRAAEFDDADWSLGPAQLGYGEGDEATVINQGPDGNRFITSYFRRTFTISDLSQVLQLQMGLLRDDGAVVYINGQEVVRSNLPAGDIDYLTTATNTAGADEDTFYPFSIDASVLVRGQNVIAVELHQSSPASRDTSFDLELTAIRASSDFYGIQLTPGVNRLVVEAFRDERHRELIDTRHIDIWYDGPAVVDPSQPAPPQTRDLRLIARDGYLPDSPVLIRLEALGASNEPQRELWEQIVALEVDNPEITLSTNEVRLKNGLGSSLVSFSGSGDFILTARLGDLLVSQSMKSLADAPMLDVAGTLTGESTSWSGVVHVVDNLLVPVGHTLTIQPGALVLLDGVASGPDGVVIDVLGTLQSLGTSLQPITLTAFDSNLPWGAVRHQDDSASVYQYTHITRGGNSPAPDAGQIGSAIILNGSNVLLDHVALSDLSGGGLYAQDSDVVLRDAQLARLDTGATFNSSALLVENTWINDTTGNALAIDQLADGQAAIVSGGVFSGGQNGLAAAHSLVEVKDLVLRDYRDAGISLRGGQLTLDSALLVDNGAALSAAGEAGLQSSMFINHVTIDGGGVGVDSRDVYNAPDAINSFTITNSIIRSADPIRSDYPLDHIQISYSNIGEPWSGEGVIDQPPQYVNAEAHDFRLPPGSPSADAGDPLSPWDSNQTLPDQGFFRNSIGGQIASSAIAGGVVSENLILSPKLSPYTVSADLEIQAGATLYLLPGTTVFFEGDAGFHAQGGRIVADGLPDHPIRLTRIPGANNFWNGIHLEDTMLENRFSHTIIEYARDGNAGSLRLESSSALLDHVTFDHTDRTRLRATDSSLIVRNSVFTDLFDASAAPTTDNNSEQIWGDGIAPGGQLLIENNVFGATKGHNDLIDFAGGSRPGAVQQILNNVFLGSGDDVLDLEGAAHIEGNLFQHIHKDEFNGDPGPSSAISAGSDNEYVVVRNVFFDVENVSLVKEDAFMTFVNNTVVGAELSALFFDMPGQADGPGRGAFVDGNIFSDVNEMFRFVTDETDLTVQRSIVSADSVALGPGNLADDPRLQDPEQGDFRLRIGSPARAGGPNGRDMGAMVAAGATVSGEPPMLTARTSAALRVDGPGVTHYRYRLNNGPWSDAIAIEIPILLADLPDGQYTVYAEGLNSAGVWQAEANASRTWTVDSGLARLLLNEVLAINDGSVIHEGKTPDIIELYNAGAATVDLSGLSISDDLDQPAKYVFPAGEVLAAGEYLVVYADDDETTSGLHTGFFLDGEGDQLYLFDAAGQGGAVLDSVTFGFQIPDRSIGRVGHDQDWMLTIPTLGLANQAARQGDARSVRINEWFADGDVRLSSDFVELSNADDLPVDLGGLRLTDDPVLLSDVQIIAPLNYIAAQGYASFQADGESKHGHVNFRLSPVQELIGLLDAQGQEIDKLLYYPQTTDYSQGRSPDGDAAWSYFRLPTPGLANVPENLASVPLIDWGDAWSYQAAGEDLGQSWREIGFDDGAWQVGPGGFGDTLTGAPVAIQTRIAGQPVTSYFRRHFQLADSTADLQLDLLADDGAVVYVNGLEVLRWGMPTGELNYRSFASQPVSEAQRTGPWLIPSSALAAGDNVIAVEVHQARHDCGDVRFAASLRAAETNPQVLYEDALDLYQGLRITEIMYNPAVGGGAAEYLELANLGGAALDLTGVRIRGDVEFDFPPTGLAPGEHLIVAGDVEAFVATYGRGARVAGRFQGDLSNGGAQLLVLPASPLDAAVLRFDFNDWYAQTDGGGYSLELADPATPVGQLSQAESWRASPIEGGTPGRGPLTVTAHFSCTSDPTPTLRGTVSEPTAEVEMTVQGNQLTAQNQGDGTWILPGEQWPAALALGSYDLQVTASDPRFGSANDQTVNELTILPDNQPPTVEAIVVNGNLADPPDLPAGAQPTSWTLQHSDLRQIVIVFSEDVSLAASDLRLFNLGVNAPAEADTEIPLSDDQLTRRANEVIVSFGPDDLPPGVYQLEILDAVGDLAGNALDGDDDGQAGGDHVLRGDAGNGFYRLPADWNGDGGVSIFDFPVFRYWFGASTGGGGAPDYVDLNRDGGVSIFDFPAFAAQFAESIVFAAPPFAPSASRLPAAARDARHARHEQPVAERLENGVVEQALRRAGLEDWLWDVARQRLRERQRDRS